MTDRWILADILGAWVCVGSAVTALTDGAYLLAVAYTCNGLLFGLIIWWALRVRRKWERR
jgi:hypothetical protein